jgi:hypothetical protein
MEVVVYLANKYADDEYMSKKLEQYLENLPHVMQNVQEERLKRIRLKHDLIERRDDFIRWFTTNHLYYYHAPTEQYVKYAKNTFTVVSEDELLQLITRCIHVELNDYHGKQQVKRRLMRTVKHRPLLNAEPNDATILNVTRCLKPQFMHDVVKTRYFLTCVGDMLHGKRNLFYFMDPSFKPLVHAIAQGLYMSVNKHISDHFKYKYYDHDFKKCRVIPGHCPEDKMMRINYLDLAVVAAHLSTTYGSSDAYLNQCNGTILEEKALMLYHHTPKSLFEVFLTEFTVQGVMPYKTMYSLWKFFLHKKTLPFVLSQTNVKQLITAMGIYHADTDTCLVGSKFLPNIIQFDMFWSRYMVPSTEAVYELAELVDVYNGWCDSKTMHITGDECKHWLETNFGERLQGDEVVGFTCKLWDKTVDIENAIEAFSYEEQELYAFYCAYTLDHSKRTVSKAYFDKYVEAR